MAIQNLQHNLTSNRSAQYKEKKNAEIIFVLKVFNLSLFSLHLSKFKKGAEEKISSCFFRR